MRIACHQYITAKGWHQFTRWANRIVEGVFLVLMGQSSVMPLIDPPGGALIQRLLSISLQASGHHSILLVPASGNGTIDVDSSGPVYPQTQFQQILVKVSALPRTAVFGLHKNGCYGKIIKTVLCFRKHGLQSFLQFVILVLTVLQVFWEGANIDTLQLGRLVSKTTCPEPYHWQAAEPTV